MLGHDFEAAMSDSSDSDESPRSRQLTWHGSDVDASSPHLLSKHGMSMQFLAHTATNLFTSTSRPSSPEKRDSRKLLDQKEKPLYIKLNIGGTRYELSETTILKRCQFGLLHRFASSDHQKRLQLCHRYDEVYGEFFFERSGVLFQNVYLYYLNGMRIHVPLYLRDHFIEELTHWGLAKLFYPDHIAESQRLAARKLSLTEKFRCVRFGGVRQEIWHLLENPESSKFAHIFALMSIVTVLLSNFVLVLSSMEQFQIPVQENNETVTETQTHPFLSNIEHACIALFTAEFVTKVLVTPDRHAFFCNYMNMIDFIAIAPFYIELAMHHMGLDSSHLQNMQGPFLVMHILRVMRVIRLFKLGRHSTGLRLFVKVIWSSVLQLGMVMAVVAIGIMFFSTLMYYLEKDVPSTKFKSIPITFWWCIVTMTTVGYGDMVPLTPGGKLVGICSILMGFLAVSMPITIFVDRFMNMEKEEKIKKSR